MLLYVVKRYLLFVAGTKNVVRLQLNTNCQKYNFHVCCKLTLLPLICTKKSISLYFFRWLTRTAICFTPFCFFLFYMCDFGRKKATNLSKNHNKTSKTRERIRKKKRKKPQKHWARVTFNLRVIIFVVVVPWCCLPIFTASISCRCFRDLASKNKYILQITVSIVFYYFVSNTYKFIYFTAFDAEYLL